MPDAPGLLDPLALGPLSAPNRIVFGPHETNLGRGRSISDRHVAYYARRAAGGAGVVVVEEASVHESDWPYERAPLASQCSAGWSAVAEACHEHGSIVLAALGHAGGQGTSHWSQRELWAPSRVPEVNTREVPKWMEAEDIAGVIEGFRSAAAAAVAAGCDGVEINAGQHSLVRQFLSGLTNHRDDEWGADRLLFARRVLAAVRDAVGPGAVVALRLSCDELAPWAGITPEAAPEVATGLVAPGADAADPRVDMLTVVRGSIYSAGATRPDGHEPEGFNRSVTAAVRSAVSAATGARVAVVLQGSVVDPTMAADALADGTADAVEMTRAQIAEARLVAKLAAGSPERIRPCVLCNQMCSVRDNRNPIVTCVADPASGHETEDITVIGESTTPVDLLVVGGGPAGLEAARVAALRGHRVRLVERAAAFGGAASTTARQPGRERFARLAGWLEAECRARGVDLVAGHEADLDEVASAERVVLATGGRPGEPQWATDGVGGERVLTAEDVLDDPSGVPGGAVLVWDPIGGPTGVAVAELLAGADREVHLATPDHIIGNELARSGDLGPANARLARAGVVAHRRRVLRCVEPVAEGLVAVLADRFSSGTERVEVGVVVDAGARLPADDLHRGLHERRGRRPISAGDSVAPRTVHEAILEGRRAALGLG